MLEVVAFTAVVAAFIGLMAFAIIICLHACSLIVKVIALQQIEIKTARRVFGRARSRTRSRSRRSSSPANDPPPPYPAE